MQDYENDNAPEWAINISFDIVKNITNGNFYSKIITQDVDFYKNNFNQLNC